MKGLARLSAEQSVIAGRNMSALRKRAEWTLADPGKRLGKDSSSIYRMEKGERRIAYTDAALLADIFRIPPVDLLAQCHNCQGSPPPGSLALCAVLRTAIHPRSPRGKLAYRWNSHGRACPSRAFHPRPSRGKLTYRRNPRTRISPLKRWRRF